MVRALKLAVPGGGGEEGEEGAGGGRGGPGAEAGGGGAAPGAGGGGGAVDSLRVSDGGTLQLLSESYGEYQVNSRGISKTSRAGAEPSAPSDDHYQIGAADLFFGEGAALGRCGVLSPHAVSRPQSGRTPIRGALHARSVSVPDVLTVRTPRHTPRGARATPPPPLYPVVGRAAQSSAPCTAARTGLSR